MPSRIVTPVLSSKVRTLCWRRYPGHPYGCPNYDKRAGCPPQTPRLRDIICLTEPIVVVWNAFDLRAHALRMRAPHPAWSDRQVYCCLYWQGAARKALRWNIEVAKGRYGEELCVLVRPEAHGVDVTATMKSIGIVLEWPPRVKAYQVALLGTARKGLDPVCREEIGEF